MDRSAPVFIVGLPRSGSTLLSRVLNNSQDILSVNDLYYVQEIIAQGLIQRKLTERQRLHLLDNLITIVSLRSTKNDPFVGQFAFTVEQLDRVYNTVNEARPDTWSTLMDIFFSTLAKETGKTHWADKTPQNFLHIELLKKVFPSAKFIFLFRDPRDIFLSYKYADGDGHDLRRYHPVPYAIYWRTAVRRYLKFKKNTDWVTMVRYEDLLKDTVAAVNTLEEFLETSIAVENLNRLGDNSSFKGDREKKPLLPASEKWICERLCKTEMRELGYSIDGVRPSISGIFEITRLSSRFAFFQLQRLLSNKDGRARIWAVLKGMFRPHNPKV